MPERAFELHADYEPAGDQPQAIDALCAGLQAGARFQTLLGVTGSGKTFTMASVVARVNRPTLVISHNKTLAAQLYSEFKAFFPENAVHYFVSYYDYYQPEAYIPQKDIYIEKDASINEDLDRLRLSATSALMTRRDVLIVASVSAIYGLGSPRDYAQMMVSFRVGESVDRTDVLRRLRDIQYERNDVDFERGKVRVRGDVLEIFPAYEETAVRIELFGDEIEGIQEIHPLTGEILRQLTQVFIYPAKHYVVPDGSLGRAMRAIEDELAAHLGVLRARGKLLEVQRLESRTRYDLEMMAEVGYCSGIENYSRHLDGRSPGSRPHTLFDYFPPDFLLFVDESHATIPQFRGMFNGDHSRKHTLVEHGFRLPSALDNRPMKFDEFEQTLNQCIFVSATPGPYELAQSGGVSAEQLVRPTGLVDPPIEVRPAESQVSDLLIEIRARAERGDRVLVTALTKRLAEDLAEYIQESGLRGRYLHSGLDAIARVEVLRSLREGEFDVLVGVNLLREGLDLPEVSLVAVLDADKEGFLRSRTALIQTIGRTARNVRGQVILYADKITVAMRETIDETSRRREKQLAHNKAHGIIPRTVTVGERESIADIVHADRDILKAIGADGDRLELAEQIGELEAEMFRLAEDLRFEEAAAIRDRIQAVQEGKGTYEGRRTRVRPGTRRKGGKGAYRSKRRPGKMQRR